MRTFLVVLATVALVGCGGSERPPDKTSESGGDLEAALTGSGTDDDALVRRARKQASAAEASLRRNPKSAAAYESLIEAHASIAAAGDNADVGELREVVEAWTALQKLDPKPDDELASAATRAAGAAVALGDPQTALDATATYAQIRNASGPYQQMAQLAYAQGNERLGDLAAQKAVALAPRDQRSTVQTDMKQLRAGAP